MRSRELITIAALAALCGSGCHTYAGSRTTAIVGAGTLAVGGGVWVASRTVDDPDTSTNLKWAALGTATLGALIVIGGIIGMVALPTGDEAALALSRILIQKAHQGNCTVVRDRAPEVEEYDQGVYDRVLLTDDAVKRCLMQ
jgi:hypothetical protein